MKKYLYSLGVWLVDKFGQKEITPLADAQFIPKIDDEILEFAAQKVIAAWCLDASGEYKRHHVYAEMIKQFPSEEKNTLGLAIELAVWGAK